MSKNSERVKRWRDKNRALWNLRRRNARKNLSGGESEARSTSNREVDGVDNERSERSDTAKASAPPAQTSKDETLERLRGLIKEEQEKPSTVVPDVVVQRIYRTPNGTVVTKEQWDEEMEKRRVALEKGYERDEWSQL